MNKLPDSRLIILALLGCVMLLPCLGRAESVRAYVNSGNQAYAAGDYEKALADYTAALQREPDSPYVLFNRGNTLYTLGKYNEALDEYEKALAAQPDEILTAKSKYNMGNARFRQAEEVLQTDAAQALQYIAESESYYRQALERAPQMTEAAKNIEIARLKAGWIKQMLQAQQQGKSQQERSQQETGQQQQDDQAGALGDLAREQQAQVEQSARAAQDKASQDAAENRQQGEELAAAQQATRQKTQQLTEELSGSGEQSATAVKKLEKAAAQQQTAEKNLAQGEFAEANKAQQDALQNMREALAAMQSSKERQEAQDSTAAQQSQQQGDTDQQQQMLDHQQQAPQDMVRPREAMAPDKTAHDILEQEKRNQQLRRKGGQGGMTGVEKDW